MNWIVSMLLVVSVLTSVTVQGVKKILDDKQKKYSSNILAAIVAVILSVGLSIGYILYSGMPVDAKVIVEIVGLCYFSFLGSTIGYDKVIQAIKQIASISG